MAKYFEFLEYVVAAFKEMIANIKNYAEYLESIG